MTSTALVLVALLAVALSVIAAGTVMGSRRRTVRRHRDRGMLRRLQATYPLATEPGERHDLCSPPSPPGTVAIHPEGLLVSLGDASDAGASDAAEAHLVPWNSLERVEPFGVSGLLVKLAHVGNVVVPNALGRQIWQSMSGPASGGAGGAQDTPMERPRPARV